MFNAIITLQNKLHNPQTFHHSDLYHSIESAGYMFVSDVHIRNCSKVFYDFSTFEGIYPIDI